MWLIIVGVLFVSGILYYVLARSMPPIVLGITIVCGAVLLFYIIRFIREKLQDKELDQIVKHMSPEEFKAYRQEVEEELSKLDTLGMGLNEPKVVSTEKVICGRIEGEVHTALLLIHEDGSVTVKCSGDRYDCEYGDVE